MRRLFLLAFLVFCAASIQALPDSSPALRSREFLSPVYDIDRKYRSEEGPWSRQTVRLGEGAKRELLWITGIRTELVGADEKTPVLPEFMCHVSLNFEDVERHRADFGWGNQGIARILALSQGQLSARFPPGFGVPLLSDENLTLTTRVLNHNRPDARFQVRHRVTIEYMRDADVRQPMKALRNLVGHVLVPLEAGDAGGHGHHAHADDGDGDVAGVAAPTMVAGVLRNAAGREFVGHWVVKPGREVRRKNVTETLQVPFDTTLHYAAIHMHPFAESMELRDLTTGESLVKIETRPLAKGIGLEHVDSFTSAKGIPIYRSHQYQMISVYNNTTQVDQDSMAVMFLFVQDPRFQRPK